MRAIHEFLVNKQKCYLNYICIKREVFSLFTLILTCLKLCYVAMLLPILAYFKHWREGEGSSSKAPKSLWLGAGVSEPAVAADQLL